MRNAEEWLLKAANQKHNVALVELGELHECGKAANASPVEAARWYRLSADQGYCLAQHRLGRCYERGIGVTRDLNQAIHWYELAAKQDFGPAKDDYQRLSESVWKRGERKFPTWDYKTAQELEKVCLTLPILSRQKALEFFQEANKVAGRSDAPLERQSCDLFEGLAGVVAASDRKEISAAWDCNGNEFLSGFLVVETHDHVIGTLTCIARISESSFLTRTWSGGVRESVKQLVSAPVGNRSRPTVETASAIHSPSWEPTVSKSYQRIDSSPASDFSHVYPRYCNICTTHPTTAVDANWSVTVLGLAIGTHLGMKDINDVERLLLKSLSEY